MCRAVAEGRIEAFHRAISGVALAEAGENA
jgi:hypothetical protein